jgi:hypothetical protein
MAEQNPLAKYQLQKAGGAGRRNTEGMFTNVNGNAARDARRSARREQRPMTFAEMQSDGVARFAPGLEMFTGQPEMVQEAPMPQVEDMTPTAAATPPIGSAPMGAPTGGSNLYNTTRSAMLANLRAQFSGERQALEEDLARRGLAASTIGAGRLGDLQGQQDRAIASLEADLLAQEDARRQANNELLVRLATLFGLG